MIVLKKYFCKNDIQKLRPETTLKNGETPKSHASRKLNINKMKIKNAAVFLMIGSIYWILLRLYYIIDSFSETRLEYTKEHLINWGFDSFSIILPISLLVLSFALMNNNKEENTQFVEEKPSSNELANNLSVGDWLVNFLIRIIPLVGFIFIIIWANDDKNKIRKNWAVASLIWTGIIFVLSMFLYATIFAAIMKSY